MVRANPNPNPNPNLNPSPNPSPSPSPHQVGVAGDLASTIGPRFKQMVRQPPYKESIKVLLKEASKSRNDGTKQVAQWANSQCFVGH